MPSTTTSPESTQAPGAAAIFTARWVFRSRSTAAAVPGPIQTTRAEAFVFASSCNTTPMPATRTRDRRTVTSPVSRSRSPIDLEPWQRSALTGVSAALWVVFTIDYGARLYLAQDRWRFVRTHPLDLLVIVLPFLRPLRALRLLRLLRAVSLLGSANRRAKRSLHARVSAYVGASVVVVLGIAAVATVEAERRSPDANITTLPDGLWWAATTVPTVGYGDRYPVTGLGRLVAVALMVVGITLLGVVTASVAAFFVSRIQDVQEAEERTEATLSDVLVDLREVRARLDAGAVRGLSAGCPPPKPGRRAYGSHGSRTSGTAGRRRGLQPPTTRRPDRASPDQPSR